MNADDAQHTVAAEALETLRGRGETLVIAPQNIIEFWAVATRPKEARGGLGLSQEATRAGVLRLTASFHLLPETPAVFGEWLRLAEQCAVSGRQVHDTRLAAWMRVNGVEQILTFNIQDFNRYPDVTPLHPHDAPANPI